MARPIGSDDRDLAFLEEIIGMALSIVARAQKVKEISDEPEVLAINFEIEGRALVIQKLAKDYGPRLRALKKEARLGQRASVKQELE